MVELPWPVCRTRMLWSCQERAPQGSGCQPERYQSLRSSTVPALLNKALIKGPRTLAQGKGQKGHEGGVMEGGLSQLSDTPLPPHVLNQDSASCPSHLGSPQRPLGPPANKNHSLHVLRKERTEII